MKKQEDRLNNTINVLYEVLEKNKYKESVKKSYEKIKELKEKRGI